MGYINRMQRREFYNKLVSTHRRMQAASELLDESWQELNRICHQLILQEHVDRQLGHLDEDRFDELDDEDTTGNPV